MDWSTAFGRCGRRVGLAFGSHEAARTQQHVATAARRATRRLGRLLLPLLLLAGFASAAPATTYVSGPIASSTTWTVANSPYVLVGAVTVNAGVVLTVDPGVVVKGQDGNSRLVVDGSLSAAGSMGAPIVFTSLLDDTAGGDTNNDGSATTPAGGQWIGLRIGSGSTGNVLDHVEVRYAGAYDGFNAAVQVITSGVAVRRRC